MDQFSGGRPSVDPGRSAKPVDPQTWNRYSYALGNPLRYVDPDGKEVRLSNDPKKREAQLRFLRRAAGRAGSYLVAMQKNGSWIVGVRDATLHQVAQMGTVAHGLAHLIASVGSFSIQLGASPQAAAGGGAAFEADGKGGGQFFVNEGAFPREIGGYSASATDAFVHEMGHGLGEVFPTSSIRGGIGGSMLVQERERAAMSFENACLRESGRERDYYLVPGDYIHPANMDYSHVIP